MKSRLIGLKDSTNGIDDENVVGLISKDKTKFRFTLEQANEMRFVKKKIESSGNDNYIDVPSVSDADFRNIEAFFSHNNIAFNEMNNDEFLNLLQSAIKLVFVRLIIYLMPEWVSNRPFPGRETIDLSVSNNLLIKLAASSGNEKVVEHLLEYENVDPSAEDNAAIRLAAQRGHLKVLELLLEDKRVNIEKLEPYLDNEDIKSIYDKYTKQKKQKTKQTETYTYENKIELYWLLNAKKRRKSTMQQSMEYELRNVEYTVSYPSDWVAIEQKENDAWDFLDHFSGLGGDAFKQFKNISQLNLSFQILLRIQEISKNSQYTMNTFLATNTRRKLNTEGKVVSEAVLTGILFTLNLDSNSIEIDYITRFHQGIAFQLQIEKKGLDDYENFKEEVGELFSFVISQLKQIGTPNPETYKRRTILIKLVSDGSKSLITRHLLKKYFKPWHKEPKTKSSWQTFPLKYLEFQMCSQCVDYISAVKWENQDRYSFCSEECARLKWESINGTPPYY